MKKMCNCCDGNNCACKCKHHMVVKCVSGLLLIVLAVLDYTHTYGMWGGKFLCGPSTDVWSWLLPLLVGLMGLKIIVLGCMKKKCCSKCSQKGEGECKDDKCCDDKKDDMKKE